MVNTDAGLRLVAANSQRRKIVIQSNGACEKGESIRRTLRRESKEELGTPVPMAALQAEIALLSERLALAKPLFRRASLPPRASSVA
ncbi:NUDIX domain-containing protein [Ralstonia syzygii subsp. celebesensis]